VLKIIISKEASKIARVAESKSNGDDLSRRRCEINRNLRKKNREYLKKIYKPETDSKKKHQRLVQGA
jgi:hypothetical protein